MSESADNLIGVGLYTPAEAGRLIQVPAGKLSRWLRGHEAGGRWYEALWRPQVDLGEDGIFLGFRDLMEARVAAAFIERGLNPQKVRKAIDLASKIVRDERPLSTTWFRTDGRSVFLEVIGKDGEPTLIDLFRSQYAFRGVLEQSLKNIEYGVEGVPARWWPLGRAKAIVVDPTRSFGRPIEEESAVPAEILAAAAKTEGSIEAAARAWDVPVRSIRRAVAFQNEMDRRKAA